MKNLFVIISFAILLCFSTIAYSADGPYVSIHAGFEITNDSDMTDAVLFPGVKYGVESEGDVSMMAAVGYRSGDARAEVEVAYQKNDLDKATPTGACGACIPVTLTGDISNLSFLLNGYYDLALDGPITPFITVGLGFAMLELDDPLLTPAGNEEDVKFAYQIGAGVDYTLSDQVTVDLKYRHFRTSNPKFGTTDADYSSHNFLAGLKYSF